MTAYQLHSDGDCGFSCPVCEQSCDVSAEIFNECTCPTLPLDENEDD